ncbi:MAG: RNA-directed DNA polymerase [Bacteriovoracaceae bacterium]|nr:RNA-directed DNA polymerase [Bacteriovoracaceae bacterium]
MTAGYSDLKPDKVYNSLVGYGMFSEKLPPCFTSEDLLSITDKNLNQYLNENSGKYAEHSCVDFMSQRNTNIPRIISVPHPEPYMYLCRFMKEKWTDINTFIGGNVGENKISFVHVKKIKKDKKIFKMNYKGYEGNIIQETLRTQYLLEAKYIVHADIANCFPSIYSHSIEWAVDGKNAAKKNLKVKPKNKSWAKELDQKNICIKDKETNGLLIGPHTSNIISEIILTTVDKALLDNSYTRIIRNIDDYEYFASSLEEAEQFLACLMRELRKFELNINHKKTKTVKIFSKDDVSWICQLNQFHFPNEVLSFSTIDAFVEYALALQQKHHDSAIINYAIKIIANKKLNKRAKKLYTLKMMSIAKTFPYLVPLLEEFVFGVFHYPEMADDLGLFLNLAFKDSINSFMPDLAAFSIYLAITFKLKIELLERQATIEAIIKRDDCIEMAMLYHYLLQHKKTAFRDLIKEAATLKLKGDPREKDRHWILLYELFSEAELLAEGVHFLAKLKKKKICFIKFR